MFVNKYKQEFQLKRSSKDGKFKRRTDWTSPLITCIMIMLAMRIINIEQYQFLSFFVFVTSYAAAFVGRGLLHILRHRFYIYSILLST